MARWRGSMSDDVAKEISDLKRRLSELETKQSAKEPPRPRMTMPKIDYTEGMSMSGAAMKPMFDLVNPKGLKYDPNAWARNRIGDPGGFGPPPDRMAQADKALREREAQRRREEAQAKSEKGDVRSAIERHLAATGWRNKPY